MEWSYFRLHAAHTCLLAYRACTARDLAGVVKNLGWLFILFPVLFDCVIIIAMGMSGDTDATPRGRGAP